MSKLPSKRRSSPTYYCWRNMLQRVRCATHPHFKDYGARGIDVDPRWHVYENFLADMGHKPNGLSLDRKDNNRGYWADNCKWSNQKEQCGNRRTSRHVEFRGEIMILQEFCRRIGKTSANVLYHLGRGRTTEQVHAYFSER